MTCEALCLLQAASGSAAKKQKLDAGDTEASAGDQGAMKNSGGLAQHCGESWHKALKAEFSKPYFVQVRSLACISRPDSSCEIIAQNH